MDPFTIAEDLSTYSAEDLAAKITEGVAALDALLALTEPTPAQADEAERIAAAVKALQAHEASRIEAAVAAVDRMEALRASRTEVVTEPEPVVEVTPEVAVVEAAQEVLEGVVVEETAVAASATRVPARQAVAGTRPAAPPTTERRVTITAAADVSGFATGSDIADLVEVGKAVLARMKAFPGPAGVEGGQLQRYGVAQFTKHFDDSLIADGNNDWDVIQHAAKESRLSGGSLLASGGWCAPSETIYNLCDGETTDGILDLPTIQVNRGGIRTTVGPQFSDFYNAGFRQTEAQAIAATPKVCYTITCPPFTDTRLDAVGLCIKVGLLQNAAWPELTRRVVSGTLIAQQHKVAADLIAGIIAGSGAVTTADVGSTTGNVLDSAGLIATTIRQEYRLGLNETLEVVAPEWLREAIRADLAMRTGVDLLAVSDAQIEGYFAARKTRVQWVYNWQQLVDGEEGYPATVKMLVYPAGTWVKGTTDVISLDAVYDAASLSTNDYTGLFVEEGILLTKTCFKSKVVTMNTSAAGLTGAASNAGKFTLTP
jgi:hypothetical protein